MSRDGVYFVNGNVSNNFISVLYRSLTLILHLHIALRDVFPSRMLEDCFVSFPLHYCILAYIIGSWLHCISSCGTWTLSGTSFAIYMIGVVEIFEFDSPYESVLNIVFLILYYLCTASTFTLLLRPRVLKLDSISSQP